jgi:transcriptional regulator with XRE-family HTH domain
MKDNKLYNNSDRLKYITTLLCLKTKDIAKILDVSDTLISHLFRDSSAKLRDLHLYAFSSAYNIPMEAFEYKREEEFVSKDEIRDIVQRNREIEKDKFTKDIKIINKLVGEWYMYSYPSNLKQAKEELWETKTLFYDNGAVEDEHKNIGHILSNQNQTIIMKESSCSKNITSITFDNSQIDYKVFLFSRVSKSNGVNRELFNFGVVSKNRMKLEDVKYILGERARVQIKIDSDLKERMAPFQEIR